MATDDRLTLATLTRHPLTFAAALVGVLGGVLKLPVLAGVFGALWASLPGLATVLPIAAFTVAPRVDFLPTRPLEVAALVVLGGFVIRVAWLRIVPKFQKRL